MMKSKFKREMLGSLTKDDGEVITDPDDILKETHNFYRRLFKKEDHDDGEQQERLTEEALNLLKTQVGEEENRRISQQPDMEELERIMNLLPSDKAPGLDGITSEVVRENWELIKVDCQQMIEAFWGDGKLTSKTKKGVVKLIPKTDDKSKLKDWIPISLAGISYKLVRIGRTCQLSKVSS
ncbi:hypothetical protein R1sor_016012 [Riccia sorocarpa]|uniref:Uncharacterized protein n=1 Tax=Riccia sorocarpa TaxID=122646 RepID=A0ABD3HDS6_9MARC